MQTWVVGATIHDEANAEDAERLREALADGGATALMVMPLSDGKIRVSFQVRAATAADAERRAVQLLEDCSRHVGVEPSAVDVRAR
jgi:predicted xylose isomerase-like sugar epimerase